MSPSSVSTTKKILDEASIQELGSELFGLVEQHNMGDILLNFTNVEFLSSAALGKLITLDRKVKSKQRSNENV